MSELPPLPEPSFQLVLLGDRAIYKVTKPNIGNTDVYTAEQMQAYARAAVQAAQPEAVGAIYERCAQIAFDADHMGSVNLKLLKNRIGNSIRASAPTPEPMSAPTAEPMVILHDDGHWTPCKTDAGRALNDRLMHAGSRETVFATPPSAATPERYAAVQSATSAS